MPAAPAGRPHLAAGGCAAAWWPGLRTIGEVGPAGRRHRRRGDAGWVSGVALLVAVVALVVVTVALVGSHRSGVTAPPAERSLALRRPAVPGGVAVDPSRFSAGSCMEYPPTRGERHEVVFLDAGHGGVDPGAVGRTTAGRTVYEADLSLPVELDTMALLRADGFTVVVSRTRASTVMKLRPHDLVDKTLTLEAAHEEVALRDICANEAKANALVGIYFDASTSPFAAGSLTLYDPGRPFSADNLALANSVQTATLAAMNAHGWGIPDDGVLTDLGMGSNNGDPSSGGLAAESLAYGRVMLIGPAMKGYFSTPSRMPGALIEPLFVTDPFEASIAASTLGQHVLAEGIAAGIERYFAGAPR